MAITPIRPEHIDPAALAGSGQRAERLSEAPAAQETQAVEPIETTPSHSDSRSRYDEYVHESGQSVSPGLYSVEQDGEDSYQILFLPYSEGGGEEPLPPEAAVPDRGTFGESQPVAAGVPESMNTTGNKAVEQPTAKEKAVDGPETEDKKADGKPTAEERKAEDKPTADDKKAVDKPTADDKKAEDKKSEDKPKSEDKKTTVNTDKVDYEIRVLKEECKALELQIKLAAQNGEGRQKIDRLRQQLATAQAELTIKDTDMYRKQHAIYT